jgi:hypothetical protein
MTAAGILGLLILALVAGGAGVGMHALCSWARWNAYVVLWLTLATALFVFEILLRSGIAVSGG